MTRSPFQVLFALVLPLLLLRAEAPIRLNRIVGPFTSRNESRLAALIRFGRENRLCFGIEFSDASFQDIPVIQLPQTTLREAVEAILVRDQGHSLAVSTLKGVVIIRSIRSHPPDWLDHRLPRFRIPRMQVVCASLNLSMALERHLNPSIQGFAGDYPPGAPADQVGPLDIRDATIRELLCTVVGASGKADWIAMGGLTLGSGKNASVNRYWTLLYDPDPVLSRPVVPLSLLKIP